MSLLAEFAVRLAAGLAVCLLLVPVRQVPPAFFRTLSWVCLGLGVLGAVDVFWSGAAVPFRIGLVAMAVLAYLSSVAWGIGLPRIGGPLTVLIAVIAAGLLTLDPSGTPQIGLDALSRIASGFFLGAVLTAMLLGHHYLTAPAMSIIPLVRANLVALSALIVRAGLAAMMLVLVPPERGSGLLLVMRWALGLGVPAVGLVMTDRTARIRSTQSATGILYATLILVLLGELAAQVLARSSGVAY